VAQVGEWESTCIAKCEVLCSNPIKKKERKEKIDTDIH
jgi:hypothetical protein